MATELILQREKHALVPATEHDLEMLFNVKPGAFIGARLTMRRSLQQQRFYWALLGKVVRNHDFYRSPEALHIYIKTRLGFVDYIDLHDGRVFPRVTSTAFDKMEGLTFRRYMDMAIDVIITEVIPKLRRQDIIHEVETMLGLRYDDVFKEAV